MAHKRIDRLLTLDEVAKLLRVHPNTVRNMIKLNKIPYIQIGRQYRFLPKELMEFLKND